MAREARLNHVLEDARTKTLRYLDDYGDGWEHTVKVERMAPAERPMTPIGLQRPVCPRLGEQRQRSQRSRSPKSTASGPPASVLRRCWPTLDTVCPRLFAWGSTRAP
jgi:hypothetical protein